MEAFSPEIPTARQDRVKWGLPEGLVLVLAAFLLLIHLGNRELGSVDEAIHAQVAREMAQDGHWLYPTCRGEPYFEKPPFKFWLTAVTFLVAGESEWTARFWSALFAFGAVWGVMLLGRAMFNRGVGLASGLVLSGTWEFLFVHCARTGELDSAVLFFMMGTVLAFWLYRATDRPRYLYLGAASMAFGFLTKGHTALIPLVWLPLVWAVKVRPDAVRPVHVVRRILGATALFLVIAAPWFLLQTMHYGRTFMDYMLRHNVAGYLLGTVEDTDTPIRYSFERMLSLDYPWPPLAVMGLLLLFRKELVAGFSGVRAARYWLPAWILGVMMVLSFSRTKLPWYHLPAIPPMALLSGVMLERWWNLGRRLQTPAWNLLWLGLHLGMLFAIEGLNDCVWDCTFDWWTDNRDDLEGICEYLFEPAMRSISVALWLLPIGLMGWLRGEGSTPWGKWVAEHIPQIRTALFVMVALGAMSTGWKGEADGDENVSDIIQKAVLAVSPHGGAVTVYVFDTFHPTSPHFWVSPALYYYLGASPRVRVVQKKPDPGVWTSWAISAHPAGVVIVPTPWLTNGTLRIPGIHVLDQVNQASLVRMPPHGVPPTHPKSKPVVKSRASSC